VKSSNSDPGRKLNRFNNKFGEQLNLNNLNLNRENLKEGRKKSRIESKMTKI
jgi:hypothetical protein